LDGGLACAVGVVCFAEYRATQEQEAIAKSRDVLVAKHGLMPTADKRLSPEYFDKNGRLMADPPLDAEKLLDPDTVVLAHYVDTDVDVQPVDWEGFREKLASVTGKKIVLQPYDNSADDVAAVKAGRIHVVALHGADTPYIVNNAGFIPVAVLGTSTGPHGNHLDIAVRAKSDIRSLADLRDRTLTCTAPDSITGYRAAIVVLSQEAGLRPGVDYTVSFSHGPKLSVLGVASGDFEAAALSDDKLQSLLKKGKIKESDYRVIYESAVIPRVTIGYVYNLQPGLAAKITATALDFANEQGAPEEPGDEPMRFFPLDYKKDFEFVRKMDNSFDPRFRKAMKSKATRSPDIISTEQ